SLRRKLLCNILANSVPLKPMYSALSLFEVDGIRWQVPVRDGMAVVMEIKALLPDRGGNQHKRPEWRVERRPHAFLACTSLFAGGRLIVGAIITKAHGKSNAHTLCTDLHFA